MAAFAPGFASHFVLDAIPHWDYPIRSAAVHPKIGGPLTFDRALLRDAVVIGSDGLFGVLYQPAETLTHRRHRLRRARCQYPIGLPYVFAMDGPVGRRQHESGSASFGISRSIAFRFAGWAMVNPTRRLWGHAARSPPHYSRPLPL